MNKIIILGSGGHAKSIVDTIEGVGEYEIAGFVETSSHQELKYKNYAVIGSDDELQIMYAEKEIRFAFIGVGYLGKSTVREQLYYKLKAIGFQIPAIIDCTASIAQDVHVEEGIYIGKNATVDANAYIGKMSIINAGSVIGHDCKIGNYSHIAVGAVLSGETKVGERTLIGANATVIQGLNIGDEVIIGAGSVILQDVSNGSRMVGNPARTI